MFLEKINNQSFEPSALAAGKPAKTACQPFTRS
jgi:hypothetical protein